MREVRLPDGTRTFRMIEGAPQRTSHGVDLFRTVVGGAAAAAPRGEASAPAPRGDAAAPAPQSLPAAPGD